MRTPGPMLARGLTALLAGLAAVALGQESPNQAEAEQRIAELDREIKSLQADLEERRGVHSREQAALKALDLEIQSNSGELRSLRARADEQEQSLAAHTRERDAYLAQLEDRYSELERQIYSAWQLGRESRLKLVLNQDSPARVSRLLAYYEYLGKAQGELISELKDVLAGLDLIRAAIDKELEQLNATLRHHQELSRELDGQREQRLSLLHDLGAGIGSDEARLAELEANRRDLETLLENLRNALADIPADLGEFRHPAEFKGQLPMPLAGRVMKGFGQARGAGLSWQGWLLEAGPGVEVRAVAYGRVAYADWLRGYGLMLIIDHGDGFMSLYGHNESLLFGVGDWVRPGAVIATVGSNPGNGQGLYFELRNAGRAVDPAVWVDRR